MSQSPCLILPQRKCINHKTLLLGARVIIINIPRSRKGPKVSRLVAKTAVASDGVGDLSLAEVHFEAVLPTVTSSSVKGETGASDRIYHPFCETGEVEACFLSGDGHFSFLLSLCCVSRLGGAKMGLFVCSVTKLRAVTSEPLVFSAFLFR